MKNSDLGPPAKQFVGRESPPSTNYSSPTYMTWCSCGWQGHWHYIRIEAVREYQEHMENLPKHTMSIDSSK